MVPVAILIERQADMSRFDEKTALELAAVEWFLQQYNRVVNRDFKIIAKQERPDVVVQASDGSLLGIEVAHLFYDGQEAKILLGRAENPVHEEEDFEFMVKQLERLLNKKLRVGQTYEWEAPLILLIRSASPLFTGADFARGIKQISAPVGIYNEIWLLARDSKINIGWQDLLRLL